jgi:hypothetical protein
MIGSVRLIVFIKTHDVRNLSAPTRASDMFVFWTKLGW